MSANDEEVPAISNFSAEEMGWVRRSDLGPDVWELPDGKLRRHWNKGIPTVAVYKGGIPNWKCNEK